MSEHKTVVIAVVGSYGKTTMKHILAEILASQGLSCSYTPGTVNTLEGIVQWVCDVYATDPTEYCIIEMGEHYVGDISAICKAVPVNHAIIT
ncbi:MAG: Mur ligase family protein [bacterium]